MNTVLPSIIKNYLDIDKNPNPEDVLTQRKPDVLNTYVEPGTGYLKSSYADYVFDQMQIVSGWLYGLEEQSDRNTNDIQDIKKNIGNKVGDNSVEKSINQINHNIMSMSATIDKQKTDIMDIVAKEYVTKSNLENSLLNYVKHSEFQDILTIINTLNEKYCNKSEVNKTLTDLTSTIVNLESKHKEDIENINKSTNDIHDRIYSYVTTQITSIKSAISTDYAKKTQLTSLKNSITDIITLRLNNYVLNRELDERLEAIGKNFVQIVSQIQYNTLKKNNKILPDNIYLITKFNRPQALYIGKFLIATKDPNADDNSCFPYTFPIVF